MYPQLLEMNTARFSSKISNINLLWTEFGQERQISLFSIILKER